MYKMEMWKKLLLLIPLALVSANLQQTGQEKQPRIEDLIQKWKSNDPGVRNAAFSQVMSRWERWTRKDRDSLREAADDRDPEVASRAREAHSRIKIRHILDRKLLAKYEDLDRRLYLANRNSRMEILREFNETGTKKEITPAWLESLNKAVWSLFDWTALLDSLLADYKKYELPLPPPEAPLVRIGFPGSTSKPYLAFLLKPGSGEHKPILLVGPFKFQPTKWHNFNVTEVQADEVRANQFEWSWSSSVFEVNTGLATAVQCRARGWNKLANELYIAGLIRHTGHDYSPSYHPPYLPPRTALAFVAWGYECNELLTTGADWRLAEKRMKRLLGDESKLNTDINRKLLKSLQASLSTRRSEGDNIEAMIDDLIDVPLSAYGLDRDKDAPVLRLVEAGFSAVPALIEHWNDIRLIQGRKTSYMWRGPDQWRVGEMAQRLLRELAGLSIYEILSKEQAQTWWKKASRMGEEAYIRAHALPSDEKAEWANSNILQIMAKRYPQLLPAVYEEILNQRPWMQSFPVVEAISASALPRGRRVDLFVHAAGNKNLLHRRSALRELMTLDREQFVEHLIKTLKDLPTSSVGGLQSTFRAVTFSRMVLETEEPRVWEALKRVAQGPDVGLRLQLMVPMDAATVSREQIAQRLKFLELFLDDATVRNNAGNPKRFQNPNEAFSYPRLEVRNYAAIKIGRILAIRGEPQSEWTTKRWAAFRGSVRVALGEWRKQ